VKEAKAVEATDAVKSQFVEERQKLLAEKLLYSTVTVLVLDHRKFNVALMAACANHSTHHHVSVDFFGKVKFWMQFEIQERSRILKQREEEYTKEQTRLHVLGKIRTITPWAAVKKKKGRITDTAIVISLCEVLGKKEKSGSSTVRYEGQVSNAALNITSPCPMSVTRTHAHNLPVRMHTGLREPYLQLCEVLQGRGLRLDVQLQGGKTCGVQDH
jgi:hypothetical protein